MRPTVRKNPMSGVAEVSYDAGRTWSPAPEPPAGSPGAALASALRGVGLGVADSVRPVSAPPTTAGRPVIAVRPHADRT